MYQNGLRRNVAPRLLHSLSFDEYKQIETSKSNSRFKFGDSKLVKSFKKVKIPVIIIGDLVYYKRKDNLNWKGSASVIGRDGQQV